MNLSLTVAVLSLLSARFESLILAVDLRLVPPSPEDGSRSFSQMRDVFFRSSTSRTQDHNARVFKDFSDEPLATLFSPPFHDFPRDSHLYTEPRQYNFLPELKPRPTEQMLSSPDSFMHDRIPLFLPPPLFVWFFFLFL